MIRRNHLRNSRETGGYFSSFARIILQVGIGLLLAVLIVSLSVQLARLDLSEQLPFRDVEIRGAVQYVDPKEISLQLMNETSGFFATDLAQLLNLVEDHIWVEQATVRRLWPDKIIVSIHERIAVARWLDSYLLDRRGEVFGPVDPNSWAHLPRLYGEPGREVALMHRFIEVQKQMNKYSLDAIGIQENPRRAWKIVLDDGVEILMGRDEDLSRLNQLSVLYPALRSHHNQTLSSIDLRYPMGAAVVWKMAGASEVPTGRRP